MRPPALMPDSMGPMARRAIGMVIVCLAVCSQGATGLPATEGMGICLGYFGPADPNHPDGGLMYQAACMAVEQANERGACQGNRFRLVTAWSDSPWGTGVRHVAHLVQEPCICAFIGGIDGPSTHLAEQVIAKARLALVGPASTDTTVNLAGVPWMFSCLPGDDQLAQALVEHLAKAPQECQNLVLLSTDDHDSHWFTVEVRRVLEQRRIAVHYHYDVAKAQPPESELVGIVLRQAPRMIIVAADAQRSAQWVQILRDRHYAGRILGGPWMARERFVSLAGPAAEDVIFPLPYTPSTCWDRFSTAFSRRTGRCPDYPAAQTYDTVNLLVQVVNKVGPDRQAICLELQRLGTWNGAAGIIDWDGRGRNLRPVLLGTVRNGCIVPLRP